MPYFDEDQNLSVKLTFAIWSKKFKSSINKSPILIEYFVMFLSLSLRNKKKGSGVNFTIKFWMDNYLVVLPANNTIADNLWICLSSIDAIFLLYILFIILKSCAGFNIHELFFKQTQTCGLRGVIFHVWIQILPPCRFSYSECFCFLIFILQQENDFHKK